MNNGSEDPFRDDCEVIESVAYGLLSLGQSFNATGNFIVGTRLRDNGNDLLAAVKRIRERDFGITRERTRDAMQASANLFRVALMVTTDMMAGRTSGGESDE